MNTPSRNDIRALATNSAAAGDMLQIALCEVALGASRSDLHPIHREALASSTFSRIRQAGAPRECARVIAENAPRAEKLTDGWSVTDPNGGRWWPSEAADEEIEASADPAETALRICRESPMRGRWIA